MCCFRCCSQSDLCLKRSSHCRQIRFLCFFVRSGEWDSDDDEWLLHGDAMAGIWMRNLFTAWGMKAGDSTGWWLVSVLFAVLVAVSKLLGLLSAIGWDGASMVLNRSLRPGSSVTVAQPFASSSALKNTGFFKISLKPSNSAQKIQHSIKWKPLQTCPMEVAAQAITECLPSIKWSPKGNADIWENATKYRSLLHGDFRFCWCCACVDRSINGCIANHNACTHFTVNGHRLVQFPTASCIEF